MSYKGIAIFCAVNLVMALFTFGYAATHSVCHEFTNNHVVTCTSESQAGHGIMAAVTWPFYWSWELQSGGK